MVALKSTGKCSFLDNIALTSSAGLVFGTVVEILRRTLSADIINTGHNYYYVYYMITTLLQVTYDSLFFFYVCFFLG